MAPTTRLTLKTAAEAMTNRLNNSAALKKKSNTIERKKREKAVAAAIVKEAIDKSAPKVKNSEEGVKKYQMFDPDIAFLLLQVDDNIVTNRSKKLYYAQLLSEFDHTNFPTEADRVRKRVKKYGDALSSLCEGRLELLAEAEEDLKKKQKRKQKKKVVPLNPNPFISGELLPYCQCALPARPWAHCPLHLHWRTKPTPGPLDLGFRIIWVDIHHLCRVLRTRCDPKLERQCNALAWPSYSLSCCCVACTYTTLYLIYLRPLAFFATVTTASYNQPLHYYGDSGVLVGIGSGLPR
jgi:hypothetical protein